MPLDPSIILGANVNAGEVAQKMQANLQQQQAAQQQLQLQQYGVAQAKQDFEDQQNWRQALAASGGDFHKAIDIAAKTGLSAKMMQSLQNGYLQQQQLQANLTKDQLANENTRREGIYSDLYSLHDIKDPGEFSKTLDQKIQDGQKTGKIKPADLSILSQLNPGNFDSAVQTFLTPDSLAKVQTANAKRDDAVIAGKNYNLNVQKSTDEHAKAIIDQNNAALQDASGKLKAAYLSGGPLAYEKALDGIQGDRADYIKGKMPTPKQVSALSVDAAKGLIDEGALTAEQRSARDQAIANAAQTANYQAQEIALRKQSNSFQQQTLGLDAAKTQAALFSAGLDSNGRPIQGQGADLLKTNTQNTSDGRLFIDQDAAFKALPKGEVAQVRQAAAKAGVPLLSSKDAAAIKDADTARNQINGVFQTFMQNAGSGTSGILLKPAQAVGNWAASVSGVNPQLDAARKNFLTAIESLKSAGGSGSGLRITGAEISKVGAMQPSLGDTQEQLQEKAKQFNQLIGDKLNSALHQVPVNAPKPSGPTGGVTVTAPDGTALSFPNQTAANAFKKAHNL